MESPPRFVTVLVEEHPAIPDGCCMRFKLAGEPRRVHRVRYEGPEASGSEVWLVAGAGDEDVIEAAWAVPVEDSGAGLCTLVYGAAHGLRLRRAPGDTGVAEPYLLLAEEAVMA